MSRPFKPDGFPQLSPYVMVKNCDETVAFYQKAFGFKLHGQPMQQDGRTVHAELQLGDAIIMIGAEGAWEGANSSPATTGEPCPIGLYIYVENVDEFFEKAKAAGAEVVSEPEDQFYGDRHCRFKDCDGYTISFGTNIADFDPSKIPS